MSTNGVPSCGNFERPSVTTGTVTVEQFRELASAAKRKPRTDKKGVLRRAWELVTDAPFPFTEEVRVEPNGRRWRFDFADAGLMLAVEVEGVTFGDGGQGRHQRAAGYDRDCEKYNRAAVLGWMVLRYTTLRLARDPAGVVEEILEAAAIRRAQLEPKPKERQHGLNNLTAAETHVEPSTATKDRRRKDAPRTRAARGAGSAGAG